MPHEISNPGLWKALQAADNSCPPLQPLAPTKLSEANGHIGSWELDQMTSMCNRSCSVEAEVNQSGVSHSPPLPQGYSLQHKAVFWGLGSSDTKSAPGRHARLHLSNRAASKAASASLF
ncbi:hypothetical protein PENANT_c031G01980 [Penicillium antarcticum]|uniref:Uncharacterized protein n=1 Tax=Penicillium antarcticum TaxID=416450 RepID=A0A1V6PV25_9EURO|nr:hypothetical protein PENANT_c031G01980 [Penicillium antarcticum]